MASREFDIIIFGATGYTGRYVIEELAHTALATDIKWAVAGRNVQKLKESLIIVQEYLGDVADISNTVTIEADVGNVASISEMCKRAKLILNCVGPYKFYGETVVTACIENGTHHVDLSGELKYLESIQAKYFQQAREKGVYIVEACGFDSIPGDYGISLLKKEFAGDLNSVEYFVEIGVGSEGRSTNMGTFLSAIHTLKDMLDVKKYDSMLKEDVFKEDMVCSNYRLNKRFPPLFYSSEVEGWCLWFMGPDERIIKRSQQFRYEYLKEKPIQSNGYLRISSLFYALCYLLFAGVFGLMALFSVGRYLLTKYPSFFTAGFFTADGPTREQVLGSCTKFTLYGNGWTDKLGDRCDQHTTNPNKKVKLTITGPEPAYPLTAMCMVQAGMVILKEKEKLPLEGGVLTPGVAFEKTTLRERLEKRGMSFTFEDIN